MLISSIEKALDYLKDRGMYDVTIVHITTLEGVSRTTFLSDIGDVHITYNEIIFEERT
jgi:hypothetical protein